MQLCTGFEPEITSYLSAISVFLSVGEFWDSFGQRGQGLEPLEDHIAKLGLQFKTAQNRRKPLSAADVFIFSILGSSMFNLCQASSHGPEKSEPVYSY